VADRACLTALSGILFVLKTGIQWEFLPHKMDVAVEMNC
jgi:transposase